MAALEIARRLPAETLSGRDLMNEPRLVKEFLRQAQADDAQERTGALFVNARNRLLKDDPDIYRGTLDRAVVEPREILKRALLVNAAGVILYHNHPSGDPAPSREDREFTRSPAVGGVRLPSPSACAALDHIVVGEAKVRRVVSRGGALREQLRQLAGKVQIDFDPPLFPPAPDDNLNFRAPLPGGFPRREKDANPRGGGRPGRPGATPGGTAAAGPPRARSPAARNHSGPGFDGTGGRPGRAPSRPPFALSFCGFPGGVRARAAVPTIPPSAPAGVPPRAPRSTPVFRRTRRGPCLLRYLSRSA